MLLKPGYYLQRINLPMNEETQLREYYIERRNPATRKVEKITDNYSDHRVFVAAFRMAQFFQEVVDNKKIELTIDFDRLYNIASNPQKNERYQLNNAYYESICSFDEPARIRDVQFNEYDGNPFDYHYCCHITVDVKTVIWNRIRVTYSIAKGTFAITNTGFFPKKDRKKVRTLIRENEEINTFIQQAKQTLYDSKEHRVRAVLQGVRF